MMFSLAKPVLHALDPETAHRLTLTALRCGLGPRQKIAQSAALASRAFGIDFANPLGLAAGFDKNAAVIGPMLDLGFGFVEIGSVTPRPQDGNPRPRMFRDPAGQALINRMGFNNDGLTAARANLAAFKARHPGRIVGANLGKNKDTAEALDDYVLGVQAFAGLADYIVINVSSPNTPGLRALQSAAALRGLLDGVMAARPAGAQTPVLLKVAPDLTDEDRQDIADVALASMIDGLIVSNTTITRPASLSATLAGQAGGLSGRPVMALSTEVLRDFHRLVDQRLPLVGVGGIASGADAWEKITAGASLIQLYTALAYQGPRLITDILTDLQQRLASAGMATIADAVGHRA